MGTERQGEAAFQWRTGAHACQGRALMVRGGLAIAAVTALLAGCSSGGEPAVLQGVFTLGEGPPETTHPVSTAGTLTYSTVSGDAVQVRVPPAGFDIEVQPGSYELDARSSTGDPCEGPEQVTVSAGDRRTLMFVCPV